MLICSVSFGIIDFLQNGVGGGDTAGSRFSQWFNREKSPPNKQKEEESRRSSLQDDNHHHHLIKNLLSDISETNVTIPGDSESYFAPISPAANTSNIGTNSGGSKPASKPVNLMEMLQRGKQPMPIAADVPPIMKNTMGMKQLNFFHICLFMNSLIGPVLSLEELEAHMLQGGNGNNDVGLIGQATQKQSQSQQKADEEVAAFKRLVSAVAFFYFDYLMFSIKKF